MRRMSDKRDPLESLVLSLVKMLVFDVVIWEEGARKFLVLLSVMRSFG